MMRYLGAPWVRGRLWQPRITITRDIDDVEEDSTSEVVLLLGIDLPSNLVHLFVSPNLACFSEGGSAAQPHSLGPGNPPSP